jgi:hypothetical protein
LIAGKPRFSISPPEYVSDAVLEFVTQRLESLTKT